MKIKHLALWGIILTILAIAIAFWCAKERRAQALPTIAAQTNPAPATLAAASTPGIAPPNINAPVLMHTSNAPAPPFQGRTEQLREMLALNDRDITFNGRVIDQFGAPVAGATVSGIIQVNNGRRVGTDRISTKTDASGLFSISGDRGKNLGIYISKAGYVMATTNTSFTYSYLWPQSQRFVPDPNHPEVVRMWKLQGAQPLVDIRKEYKLPFTNAPISFDLISRKIVSAGGDIVITVNRPNGEIVEQNPQDWGFTIQAADGGLIETSGQEEAITFGAPESGYQPSYTLTASENRHGIGLIQQAFFVQSRNGQVYSKLSITFSINADPNDPMNIALDGVASTNRSRNWEATALSVKDSPGSNKATGASL